MKVLPIIRSDRTIHVDTATVRTQAFEDAHSRYNYHFQRWDAGLPVRGSIPLSHPINSQTSLHRTLADINHRLNMC